MLQTSQRCRSRERKEPRPAKFEFLPPVVNWVEKGQAPCHGPSCSNWRGMSLQRTCTNRGRGVRRKRTTWRLTSAGGITCKDGRPCENECQAGETWSEVA